MKYKPFSITLDLFHAQAILGTVSMKLPYNKNFDKIREKLFDVSIKMLEIGDLIESIEENESEV